MFSSIFLDALRSSLDCGENDSEALFALCLIQAAIKNKGKNIVNRETVFICIQTDECIICSFQGVDKQLLHASGISSIEVIRYLIYTICNAFFWYSILLSKSVFITNITSITLFCFHCFWTINFIGRAYGYFKSTNDSKLYLTALVDSPDIKIKMQQIWHKMYNHLQYHPCFSHWNSTSYFVFVQENVPYNEGVVDDVIKVFEQGCRSGMKLLFFLEYES